MKRTSKAILCIALALAMAFAALPMAAFAAETELTPITGTIVITGIKQPVAGSEPTYAVLEPNANYTLSDEIWVYRPTFFFGLAFVKPVEDTFEAKRTVFYSMVLEPKEGYYFDNSVTVVIDGVEWDDSISSLCYIDEEGLLHYDVQQQQSNTDVMLSFVGIAETGGETPIAQFFNNLFAAIGNFFRSIFSPKAPV